MNNSEQLDDLITRSFCNGLNSDEQAFLLQWLHASEENRQYYEALKNTWQLMKAKQTPGEVNVDKEWAYFKEYVQRGDREYTGNRGIVRKIVVAMAIAASVLLVIGAGFWFTTNKSKPVAVTAAVEKNTPATIVVKREANTSGKARLIVLPDSSNVLLDPSSEITWHEPFINNRRDVVLKGSARFNVAKDKARPFTVISGQITTTALGTQFTVTAFEQEDFVTVQLFEGKVVIKPADSIHPKLKTTYYLLPGEELLYSNKQNTARVRRFINDNPTAKHSDNKEPNTIDQPSLPADKGSWYMFNNQALAQVFRQLEALYGVDIVFSEKDLEKMYFIGKFSKTDSISNILKQIAALNNLSVTKENNSYIITKGQ